MDSGLLVASSDGAITAMTKNVITRPARITPGRSRRSQVGSDSARGVSGPTEGAEETLLIPLATLDR
jgi:hypothetical protein